MLAICFQETGGGIEQPAAVCEIRFTIHGCRAVRDGRRGRRATLEERLPSPQFFK